MSLTTGTPLAMIDFESLESQKENIEPLRAGRSATSLAKAFNVDPISLASENDATKNQYELELKESSELDDPLEVWARYITWTKQAYPAGQSAHSGYVQLLERCSKQFIRSVHYLNDPRYLKIWIEYARYSDDPREMFCFLARNNIGQDLATFYEEYANFLEVRSRKGQADEVYQMGLLRGARPVNRLRRKYEEFSQRLATNPAGGDEPSSPPIAPVRAALTTKFGGLAEAQQLQPTSINLAQKLQIFADEIEPPELGAVGAGGWGSIGTLQSRRKENSVEVRKMMGEKLYQKGPSVAGANKLEIFKDDPTVQLRPVETMRRSERVVCNLEAIYANEGQESSFEELKAQAMGLLDFVWPAIPAPSTTLPVETYVSIMDSVSPLKDSPQKRPMKRQVASPTINTKAAMDDILGLFNQPLRCEQSDQSSDSESDDDEPDNTFAVNQEMLWNQKGTQNTVGRDYQSDFNEDDRVDNAFGKQNDKEVLSQPILPGPPLAERSEEVNESFRPLQSCDVATIPATPQHQAVPKRVNGFDLMTPITEDTENLQISAITQRHMAVLVEDDDDENAAEDEDSVQSPVKELYSSPFVENPPPRPQLNHAMTPPKLPTLLEKIRSTPEDIQTSNAAPVAHSFKGPLQERLCNPMDGSLRMSIFATIIPQISAYEGCQMQVAQSYGKKFEAVEKYIRALHKKGGEATQHLEVILDFVSRYSIKKKLGEGAFAPVFLVENISGHSGSPRSKLEAIKIEKPGSAWEFYIMRQIHRRLGISRASQSVAMAHEYYEFSDCSFLILDYKEQGTILDLVNMSRSDAGGVDEILAIFLTIELLRTVEAMHAKELMHGDLKPDNCLLRLNPVNDNAWSSSYQRNGDHEWQNKGITLIDFGRGIDMKHFQPDVQFIADWNTDEQDCIEMREARPWTYQIDYHGLACIIHSLLFGKYIETVSIGGLGAGKKRYGLKNSFKRYWKQDIWEPLFDLLLNPLSHGRFPLTDLLKTCRERLEDHLEEHGNSGIGLKGMIRKVEIDLANARKK